MQPVVDALDQACRERTIYMIGPEKGRRLAELVREKRPALVVECGTAIGYSGLWIGRELKRLGAGRLITLEIDAGRAREAAESFRRAGLEGLIEVRVGDARELVKAIRGPVDMLFIDCNFENYAGCYEGIRGQLADGALVVADNVGIGAAAMADYLAAVRAGGESRTEWFDMDLPWGKRDAMEVSIHRAGRGKRE